MGMSVASVEAAVPNRSSKRLVLLAKYNLQLRIRISFLGNLAFDKMSYDYSSQGHESYGSDHSAKYSSNDATEQIIFVRIFTSASPPMLLRRRKQEEEQR